MEENKYWIAQDGSLFEMPEEQAKDFMKKNPEYNLVPMTQEAWTKRLVEHGGI